MQMLLEAGADALESNSVGWTALHASVGSSSTSDWFTGRRRVQRVRSAFDCAAALLAAGADANVMTYSQLTPLMLVGCAGLNRSSHMSHRLFAVLLRGGATLDDHILEHIKNEYGTWCSFSYLDKVHDAGGWKRYAHAHRTRLVATFAPKLPLPADVIPLVVDFWANVGMY